MTTVIHLIKRGGMKKPLCPGYCLDITAALEMVGRERFERSTNGLKVRGRLLSLAFPCYPALDKRLKDNGYFSC